MRDGGGRRKMRDGGGGGRREGRISLFYRWILHQ